MDNRETFDLGLVMAGAISAGAYTAGVIDFLFEALDAINDVRAGVDTAHLVSGQPGDNPIFDPGHDVRIRAMSGTSAGAMVTAIVATVLGTRVPPVNQTHADTGPTGNPLYEAWVNQIHYDRLLGTSDLAPEGASLHSALDGTVLDRIVKDSLTFARRTDYVRPYVYEALPIYLCVGNLRGVRYSLSLEADPDAGTEHQMSMHADHVGFCFRPRPNGPDEPALRTLVPGGDEASWKAIGDAALASGAFPVGLPSRALARQFADYVKRPWFDPGKPLDPLRRTKDGVNVDPSCKPASWQSRAGGDIELPPLDRDCPFPGGEYDFVNVDGGVFNNEPLELCRIAMSEGERAPRDAADATKSVLLIDPFPNLFALDTKYNTDEQRQILNVLKNLVSAYTSQSRFKPSELALARDPHVASRAAIMPVRYVGDNAKPEKYAIACGALGGFGGFLSREFRHHDFMLGRRNCQRFLSRHLALPADEGSGVVNKLFSAWPKEMRAPFEFKSDYSPGAGVAPTSVTYLPVIPLLGKLGNPSYTAMPPWPVSPRDLRMADLEVRVLARADAVKEALVRELQPSFIFRTGINTIWWQKKAEWVKRFAIDPVTKDLETRGHRVQT